MLNFANVLWKPALTYTVSFLKTRLFQLVEENKFIIVIWSELTIYNYNIESYNSALCGNNDGVVFNVRDQAETTSMRSCGTKDLMSSQLCMHLSYVSK